MRIVVTGGLGFIGTSVVRRLIAMGHEVIVVDRAEKLLRSYEAAGLPILREIYRNLKDCVQIIEPWDFLSGVPAASAYVHLGACVDTRGVPDGLFENNIHYTNLLIDRLPYDARVVYASSAAVYGTEGFPCNAYGMSKKMGENLLRKRPDLRSTALRFFNVYGRHEQHKGEMASVPHKIANAYRTKGRFGLFCPDASRDFISVDDVANAVIGHVVDGSDSVPNFEVFDVGTGHPMTFRDLDYSLKILFQRQETVCDEMEMPSSLTGHYQFYTCAGSREKISPYVTIPEDIRDSLKEQFIEKDR